jgi:hypothetical protein
MSKLVQEKFQACLPDPKEDGENQWISDKQARAKKSMPGREGVQGGDGASRFMSNAAHFNALPPGADIEDQEVCDIRRMGFTTAGNNPQGEAVGDVTQDLNARSARTGFDRKSMRPTDDMYSNEHVDAFYGEATVDGETGFLERNNNLDRL